MCESWIEFDENNRICFPPEDEILWVYLCNTESSRIAKFKLINNQPCFIDIIDNDDFVYKDCITVTYYKLIEYPASPEGLHWYE